MGWALTVTVFGVYGLYLAVGVVTWWPLTWLGWRKLAEPRTPFRPFMRHWWRRHGWRDSLVRVLVQVVAWPACVWEVVRS